MHDDDRVRAWAVRGAAGLPQQAPQLVLVLVLALALVLGMKLTMADLAQRGVCHETARGTPLTC